MAVALVMPIAFDLDLFYIAPFYHRYINLFFKEPKIAKEVKLRIVYWNVDQKFLFMGKCLP